jgi:hypothetical protein
MPLKKLLLKSGINRENTRYTSEGGWYECDKIRFRQGSPEKIGGWTRTSNATYLGVCRSLWSWVTLDSQRLVGVGTNEKFYIENGTAYNDITPIRATVALTDPFATVAGSTLVTVTDTNGGYVNGDYVTFSNATAVGGVTVDGEYQLTLTTTDDEYTVDSGTVATSTATGGGTVTAVYQIASGTAFSIPTTGWGASGWGSGPWGEGQPSAARIRLWSQSNFGEDLIFGPRGGGIYYWDATSGLTSRAVELSTLVGATDAPTAQRLIEISDINRFVFAFGANEFASTTVNPMLVRWSDQGSAINWTPSVTSQAGFLTLSRGSEIVSAKQSRQEVLVWTDAALYAMQYVGAPVVWSAQLVGENISIAGQNAVAYANGVSYWMGKDKFYKYDGRTQPLRCDLRKFVFGDFNEQQYDQVVAGTNESYHEVWWFYCSKSSNQNDRYVIYNYLEDVWYYGNLGRTAWLDSGLRDHPLAATYSNNLVEHEQGVDDGETDVPTAITAFVTSAEFDIDDGHQFSFVSRVLPDIRFNGSTAVNPTATITLFPLANSGSGYNSPLSAGGNSGGQIVRSATLPVEQYTGQIDTRIRGRQMSIKVESTEEGVAWQLGAPRIDLRPDGRR